MKTIRIITSTLFLATTILSVPLAFDVGGRKCGLAFSLLLSTYYTLFSIFSIFTPDKSRFRYALLQTAGLMQWLIVPGLLIWALGRYPGDAATTAANVASEFKTGGWMTWTGFTSHKSTSQFWERLFAPGGPVESRAIHAWEKVLTWSTPLFQLGEGFCSLLIIQAAGGITRWLVNRTERSDSWMIGLLVFSASTISSAVYFLWRITTFPLISNLDATLIGMTITCAIILCAWGIGSGKGNPVESSLLFAYIVLCIYQIFTDYLPSHPTVAAEVAAATTSIPSPPAFPPIIMESYTTLLTALSTLPAQILAAFNFIIDALSTVTPSVLISLAFRVTVLYLGIRIIPAIRESGAPSAFRDGPDATAEALTEASENESSAQVLGLLSRFSPTILIAVYTNLLMQHFALIDGLDGSNPTVQTALRFAGAGIGTGNLWRWINVVATMALYAVELYLGSGASDDVGVITHWKTD